MDLRDIGAFVDQHYRAPGDTLWRLEVLPAYIAKSDGRSYQLWLDGAETPDMERKNGLLSALAAERADGLRAGRTRILGDPRTGRLTDYELYACEFGYAYNAPAGEDVRVIHRTEHQIPPGVVERDFWLVNGIHVIDMEYDADGRFVTAEQITGAAAEPYLRTRQLLEHAGVEFQAWWDTHTELHRRRQRAA